MTDVIELLTAAQADEGVKSSELSGASLQALQGRGFMRVDKYRHAAAYLVEPSVIAEFVQTLEHRRDVIAELRKIKPLIEACIRLGVDASVITSALIHLEEDPSQGVLELAEQVAARAEELEAGAAAQRALAQDIGDEFDLSLDEFAAALGVDIAAVRADVAAGTGRAQISLG